MILKQDAFFTPSQDIRPLHIWLPEDYYRTDERYPVMYMFDGHNLFSDQDATYGTCWGFQPFLEGWPKKIIVVGLECSHRGRERLKEYCPYHLQDSYFGDLYGIGAATFTWMVEVLKPYIDRTYRTYSFREATGIGGSSMGGLMSLYGVIRHNEVFSKAACLSSSVTPCLDQIMRDIDETPLDPDTRVYLSWGEQEGRMAEEKLNDSFDTYTAHCNRAIQQALEEKQVATRLYFQPGGGHCEADWAKQVAGFMDFLWRS